MPLTIDTLVASPDHYFFALEGDQAVFVAMDRSAYGRSIFLDSRIVRASDQVIKVPVRALLEHHAAASPITAPGWIFHVAHCGSTLLARALDYPEGPLVLREPIVLRQLGVAAMAIDQAPVRRLAAALAGRRYPGQSRSIAKANVPVNFIAAQLLECEPRAPAIFLYFAFEQYLAAILRSPNHRNWVRSITTEMEAAIAAQVGSFAGASDAERAAALWLAQIRLYHAAIERFDHASSLDAELLFNAPRMVVAAAAAHFGATVVERDLDAVVGGELFATYSKNPSLAFDNAARLARQQQQKRLIAGEIALARRWLDRRLPEYPIPDALGRPLTGNSPQLLA